MDQHSLCVIYYHRGAVEAEDTDDILLNVDCQLIMLLDPIPGRLRITKETLSFIDNNPAGAGDGIGNKSQ